MSHEKVKSGILDEKWAKMIRIAVAVPKASIRARMDLEKTLEAWRDTVIA